MTKIRSSVLSAALVFIGTICFVSLLVLVAHVGRAFAGNGPVTIDTDPIGLFEQFFNFMKSGKGMMAVGIANLLVVWVIRSGLALKIPFFKTMLGGYLLNFGGALLEYIGIGLSSTGAEALTVGLFVSAIGAGFVGAGGWETLRDLITKITSKPMPGTA